MPTIASDICDEGTLDTACYVFKPHTIADGHLVTGQGDLIVQAGGRLSASASLASFRIEMAGDIEIEKDGVVEGNLNIKAANLTIYVGGLMSAEGWGPRGAIDELGGRGGAAGGTLDFRIGHQILLLGTLSVSGKPGIGGGDGGPAGEITFHGGSFYGFSPANSSLCENTQADCQGNMVGRGGDGGWAEGHAGAGGRGGEIVFYGPLDIHGGFLVDLHRGSNGEASPLD